ncbi:MAG: anthranilate phosphoribosyltransferase [Anaerolineae bacterium]|nr:MAG: anthranilate phosphoribosyltransferase [Anaerolineae bacterium]
MPLKSVIGQVINGQDLTVEQAEEAMDLIMEGLATDAQIGSYLTALRMKGETTDEIAGSARSMRAHVVRVEADVSSGEMLVDTCGTGGDGLGSFNISTTAAFVVAGYGVKVAKHGNRAASSKSGSADVLMALGGNLDLNPEQVAACINEINIGFLYAVNHHPAMRNAIAARREIGQRTIFNLLGPLTNPARASHQLMGVYDGSLTETVANVLAALGANAALVVHGADGMDELSTTGINYCSRLKDGSVTSSVLDPETFGFERATLADLRGGNPEENARITIDILAGKDNSPRRDIVLLNAAAALSLDNQDLDAGLGKARESIDSGGALRTLEAWIEMTQSFRE